MLNWTAATRIFVCPGVTDMRKGFNGLADLVRHQLQSDPLSGHLFVFCNRRRNRLKVLCWDGSGLWLCTKRLEKGCFSWPKQPDAQGSLVLSGEQWMMLVGGLELERTRQKDWWRRAA